jgi:hypothetical protein
MTTTPRDRTLAEVRGPLAAVLRAVENASPFEFGFDRECGELWFGRALEHAAQRLGESDAAAETVPGRAVRTRRYGNPLSESRR